MCFCYFSINFFCLVILIGIICQHCRPRWDDTPSVASHLSLHCFHVTITKHMQKKIHFVNPFGPLKYKISPIILMEQKLGRQKKTKISKEWISGLSEKWQRYRRLFFFAILTSPYFQKLLPKFPWGRSHFSLKFWASLNPVD